MDVRLKVACLEETRTQVMSWKHMEPGMAALVVVGEDGPKLYKLSSDDPAIAELKKKLADEVVPPEESAE